VTLVVFFRLKLLFCIIRTGSPCNYTFKNILSLLIIKAVF